MSTPVATPTDLGTYLNISSIDTNRATLILGMAQDLCETIVSPLPTTAKAVVLDVAARAFVNPQQLADAALGTAHLQYGAANGSVIGGLYLSRTNKATLKALAGRGSAFTADVMPTGTNAVQTITVAATAGTFTLTFSGATTTPLAYNATATDVQAALETLGAIGSGNVQVTGAYTVTFVNNLGTQIMPPITADATNLTGTVTVDQTVTGVKAPGQDLPPWDYDYYRSSSLLGSQFYGPL